MGKTGAKPPTKKDWAEYFAILAKEDKKRELAREAKERSEYRNKAIDEILKDLENEA